MPGKLNPEDERMVIWRHEDNKSYEDPYSHVQHHHHHPCTLAVLHSIERMPLGFKTEHFTLYSSAMLPSMVTMGVGCGPDRTLVNPMHLIF